MHNTAHKFYNDSHKKPIWPSAKKKRVVRFLARQSHAWVNVKELLLDFLTLLLMKFEHKKEKRNSSDCLRFVLG